MDWLRDDVPAFPDYTQDGRCPDCRVPVGAIHMDACRFEGVYRPEDDEEPDRD